MRMKYFVLGAGAMVLLSVGSLTYAATRTVTLVLEGMYCAMCPVTIKTALDFADGVHEAKVVRNPDQAVVKYDDAKTSPDKLIRVIKEAGYGAHVKKAGEK